MNEKDHTQGTAPTGPALHIEAQDEGTGLGDDGITPYTSEKPDIKPGELVKQDHGGAIRNGSEPGTNKGGSGRPPSKVRQACTEGFDELVPELKTLATEIREALKPAKEGECPRCRLNSKSTLIREFRGILDTFGKYGIGTKVVTAVDDVEWIRISCEGVRECFPGQQQRHLAYVEWLGKRIGCDQEDSE